nr:Ig-like domain-containing protein [Candidatus Dormibacteraeota bacterium]
VHDLGKGPTVNAVQVLTGSVVVVFDSDLDPKTVDGSARLTAAGGSPVTVSTAYANRRLTVSSKLTPGAKYHLELAPSIKDIAGQALQGGYEYDFVAVGSGAAPAP